MSGICVYFRRDGSPVDDDALERMMEAAHHRGPDGARQWKHECVGLGHLQMCTTPESEYERQPTFDEETAVCLAFDGRVDNRDELIEQLSLSTFETVPITDSILVLRAYSRWGADCVERLVGDFAFALWDQRARRLLCARDAIGVRPLYYVLTPRFFAAASGLPELFTCGGVSKAINEAMVGEYLSVGIHSQGETLYRDVQRLPPGHLMSVDTNGICISRYWKPERIDELRLSDDEYAERFRFLFRQAVLACSRSNRALAADLSGGLDSSSVVCMLAALERDGVLQQQFETFTLTFPGLGCDETDYAGAVVQRWGCEWTHVPLEPAPMVDYHERARRYQDFPGYPNGTSEIALQQLGRNNIRVSLRGVGADEWLGGASDFDRSFDLARQLQLAAALKEFGEVTPDRLAKSVSRLGSQLLRGIKFDRPRCFIRRRRLPPWIKRDFERRIGLVSRQVADPIVVQGWGLSRHARLLRGTSAWRAHALELEERVAATEGVEFRHPFLDRRLVEFMLALPEQQCRVGRTGKVILRTAMADLLPDVVRLRQTKADFSHLFRRTLMSAPVRRWFDQQSVARSEWVDAELARVQFEFYCQESVPESMWSLWMLYGIDIWAELA